MDDENTKAKNDGSYYCMNVPEGTTFKVMVAGSRYNVKVTFLQRMKIICHLQL